MIEDETVKGKVDTSRYQHAKIYKLVSNQTTAVYYGSSCNLLRTRLGQHKSNYKLWQTQKYHYVTSFEIVKYSDCDHTRRGIQLSDKGAITRQREMVYRKS